jgi:hypothetical protein
MLRVIIRWRTNDQIASENSISTPTAIPTPIPAVTLVERILRSISSFGDPDREPPMLANNDVPIDTFLASGHF